MPALHVRRKTGIQLAVFVVITVSATVIMALSYMRLPELLFGAGHYTVTVQLSESGGLYHRANVTYRGVEVGRVKDVRLTGTGVEAVLSLKSGVPIPSDLDAEVHSQTAIGEQYVELLPRNSTSPPLKNGDIIKQNRTSVPPDINSVLDATNRGLRAIPGDNLKTVIDESYAAFGGLGPEISRLVRGSTDLAIDGRTYLNELTNLVDNSGPLLDTQTDTSGSVRAWAAHLATVAGEFRDHDNEVGAILQHGSRTLAEGRGLLDRLQPTLPILLANLASVAPVLVTYQPDLEETLVLFPMAAQMLQATSLADSATRGPTKGVYMDFNLNLNLPPPCNTGYLPAQQIRSANLEDYPDLPPGDLYCRVPQDSMFNVRGARNIPCETRPGKRAPTVKMCESDQNYVPLNDGFTWKGDPNATLSGQDVPQLPPASPPPRQTNPAGAPAPIPEAAYDPATGRYIGPDGHVYTQGNLSPSARHGQTWQSLLTPP
jgi:phospholipid/cholesterol/gamma-HCH transport system substrate-binding protein